MRLKKFDEWTCHNKILKSEIELLEKFKISEYRFNKETNLIDVQQDVDISMQNISKIEIRFGEIWGKFDCSYNVLTSLKNCPKEINGNFICSNNKLISLEHCPKYINGSFNCSSNILTSLKGCPSLIEEHGLGNFSCVYNRLTSLEYCPRYVFDFYTYGNDLNIWKHSQIEDYPLSIIENNLFVSNISNDFSRLIDNISHIVKENKEIFEHFLDNKIKFHQMVMRLDQSLIPFYKTIPPPSKKSTLLV